jgi:hypothetical protein
LNFYNISQPGEKDFRSVEQVDMYDNNGSARPGVRFPGLAVLFFLALAVFSAKAQDNPAQADSFAKVVVKSFSQSDFKLFESTMLPAEAWSLFGAEWDSIPDTKKKEIQKQVTVRIKDNFTKIVSDAKAHKVNLKKITYDGVKTESNPEFGEATGTELVGMEIYFQYNGKRGRFALAVFKVNDRLYTSEILRTTGIFDELQ